MLIYKTSQFEDLEREYGLGNMSPRSQSESRMRRPGPRFEICLMFLAGISRTGTRNFG